MDILAVENLSISFKTFDGIYQAIEKINFSLKKGEILGIVGETGCGKSVTARAIMNLLPERVLFVSQFYAFRITCFAVTLMEIFPKPRQSHVPDLSARRVMQQPRAAA